LLAFQIRSARLEILDGDITIQDVDAVVNAANNHFWMGAGVAGALKARGGPEIEREAMQKGPVAPGQCVITGGGRLTARHVIHAAVMGQTLVTSGELIQTATRNSLALAEQRALTSIAFPLFGTGVGGYSIVDAARVMIEEFDAHEARQERNHSLALIRLVAFGQAAYRTVAAVAADRLGTPVDGPPDCPISG
jgi:O-acetyl-ADP-ribose deacetylase (regulator of RNase III)